MNANLPNESWSFTSQDIFERFGFNQSDSEILRSHAEELTEAAVIVFNAQTMTETKNSPASSTAPLFVAGKRYHINLSKSAKEIAADSVRIVGVALLLHNLRILDFSVTLSVRGFVSMLSQVTRLSDDQRRVVLKILKLKRASKSRTVWPTTKKLANALKISQKQVITLLAPINGKVVLLDLESSTYKLLW